VVGHGVVIPFAANQSTNWSGYNQGSLALGGVLFHEVAADWTVPTPSQHKAGEAEYSSDWVGIGGGCVDQNCLTEDPTLIQAGTAQYIDSSGNKTYFAWWEIIPGPILQIANFNVNPGDSVGADIRLKVADSDVWRIQVYDFTQHETFTTTVPYSSGHLTAEWIEERPSIGGLPAPLPRLTNPRFNNAVVNKAPAVLNPASLIAMDDGITRYATPSNPDPDRNGFNVCTYASSCAAPTTN
jgi:Peptidase A4 family